MEFLWKKRLNVVVELLWNMHEEGKNRMLDNVNGLTPPRVFWAPVKAVCKMRWLTEHDQKNAIFVTQIVCTVYYYYGLEKNNFQSLDAMVLFHGINMSDERTSSNGQLAVSK